MITTIIGTIAVKSIHLAYNAEQYENCTAIYSKLVVSIFIIENSIFVKFLPFGGHRGHEK